MTTTLSTFPSPNEKFSDYLELEPTERTHSCSQDHFQLTFLNPSEATQSDFQYSENPKPLKKHLIKINLAEELFGEPSPKNETKKRDPIFSLASGESNITSEDLIINENIDFLYEDQLELEDSYSSSVSPSFNYTKSDKSSCLGVSPRLLTQSFSDLQNESNIAYARSFDTQDPEFCFEKVRDVNGWQECKEQSRMEKERIIQEIKGFLDIGKAIENQDNSILFDSEEPELKSEELFAKNRCGCSSCCII